MPQSDIRPPRWESGGGGGGEGPEGAGATPKLQGGSRSTSCALCPISMGAFKQSTSGEHWIHLVSPPQTHRI